MRPFAARATLGALVAATAVATVVAARSTDAAESPAVAARTANTAEPSTPALPVLAASAPSIDADGWLNTAPLAPEDLAGEVVLYEFWTFGCVNCRNVLPYVRAWHDRYAADGLVVLSIHTPEFGYEADPDAVGRFVEEQGVPYPVALDPERRVWRAFANHYWPAMYLHDRQGRRRLVHIGEGGYTRTEDAIRLLLGVNADAPRADVSR